MSASDSCTCCSENILRFWQANAVQPTTKPKINSLNIMSTINTADGLKEALQSLQKEMVPELESALRFGEANKEADKHRKIACGKLQERKSRLQSLQRAYKKLQGDSSVSADTISALADSLHRCEDELETIKEVQPGTGSLFVRLFLGKVNVKVYSKADREKLREEYEKFKDRTNAVFMVFPLIWALTSYMLSSLFRYTDWIYTLTHIWLFYYYISLAMRENILKMNGSHIRPWWIYHHYISAFMSVIVLTWPAETKSWKAFMPQFTAYFLYQGFVQIMQARYQKARHYARVAMGKATTMDVSNTETLTEFHRGLWLIVFLVVLAHSWQMFNGYSLFHLLFVELDVTQPWYDFREEVQCAILGAMFFLLGVVNFSELVLTLWEKTKRERSRISSTRNPATPVNSTSVASAVTSASK